MKHILLTLFSFFFLSQTTLLANEPIEAEELLQEEVIQEEVVAEEPTDDALVEEEAMASENTGLTEDVEEVASNAPGADELEAAAAEEAELREVGAGEEPIAE